VANPDMTPILEFCPRSGHSAGTEPSFPALVFSRIYRKRDFAGTIRSLGSYCCDPLAGVAGIGIMDVIVMTSFESFVDNMSVYCCESRCLRLWFQVSA
jgi:hypothetical protein